MRGLFVTPPAAIRGLPIKLQQLRKRLVDDDQFIVANEASRWANRALTLRKAGVQFIVDIRLLDGRIGP